MKTVDIVALTTALGIGGILTKLVEWFIQTQKEKKKKKEAFTRVFDAVNDIYYCLLSLLRNSDAHRIVLLKTTNGGGRPRLSSRLYSSVVYEAYEFPLNAVKNKWQNQLIDEHYVGVLHELDKKGSITIRTSYLDDCMIRNLYIQSEIKQSILYKIHQREDEFIYLSANFIDEVEDNPQLNEVFRYNVSRLKTLFSENENI